MIRPTDPQPNDAGDKPERKGRKATTKEVNDRVFAVAQMLVKKVHPHEIRRYLEATHGLKFRQAAEYTARAQAYLIERSGRPKDEWVSEALGFLESILRDQEADHSIKLQANRDICNLLGLNAPTKIAPTTPDGESPYQPIDVSKLTDEELVVLHKLRARLDGQPRSPAGGTTRPNGSPGDSAGMN